MDLILGLVAGAVTLPFACVIAALTFATHGPPILFRQARTGLDGRTFILVKFRTMLHSQHGSGVGATASDAERLNRLGRFLRATSLDELPELINVLKGDMSLVGPRPLLPEYLPLYNANQRRRHEVRPGITGWAQVNGRNAISWEEQFELDVWYVDHQSLALDLKILALTVLKVFARADVTQPGQATREPFRGSGR